VFYSNYSHKFTFFELRTWDRQTDKQTDGQIEGLQHCIMPPLRVGDIIRNMLNNSLKYENSGGNTAEDNSITLAYFASSMC